jgi:ACS family hexuronate transporter-like MFS transporter
MGAHGERSSGWRYSVCGLLLLATMLNYMDRQTLSQLATTIRAEYHLSHAHYGGLEEGFGYAFAAGALFFGFLADRLSVRWLYPAVLLGWSLAGMATAEAPAIGATLSGWLGADAAPSADPASQSYLGFLTCRIVLGFFEAGHWPCALITTHVILTRKDRSLGNSILQSGAALGAILTPIIVMTLLPATDAADHYPPGTWRLPFLAIGALGMTWTFPWLVLVRGRDLDRGRSPTEPDDAPHGSSARGRRRWLLMCAALVIVVITINLCWQFFRAWLPMFLEEDRSYTKKQVQWLTAAYYIAADAGCLSVGFTVKWLAGRGWDVHRARMLLFAGCTGLTVLSVAFVILPAGPMLVGLLLVVAAGALGLFPNYYSFAQEPSRTHQGKVSGSLGTIAWVASSRMQKLVGSNIDATRSYAAGIIMAGLAPVAALLAMLVLWPRQGRSNNQTEAPQAAG